jgi:hypothetical protein
MKNPEKYVKINTNDPRIEMWGCKKGKTLSLYAEVKAIKHAIPLGNNTNIIYFSGSFQVNNIKIKI